MIYLYLLISCNLITVNMNINESEKSQLLENFDNFFYSFDEFCGIFFKMRESKFLLDFHEIVK
jgi:hypothetical protein